MTDPLPDWVRQTPNLPSLHSMPDLGNALTKPYTQDELARIAKFFIQSFIGQIAIAFGGIEIAGWKPFEFLAEWGQNLVDQANAAYLGQETANNRIGVLADIFGITDVDLDGDIDIEDVWKGSFVGKLFSAFDGIDLDGGPGAVLSAIGAALADVPVVGPLLNKIAALLAGTGDGETQNLVQSLFALLRPEWLPEIPFTSIGDYGANQPNLLLNPGFDGADSIAPNGEWSWDGAVGDGGLGSAKIVCDGSTHALLSNEIPCSAGQNVEASIRALWSGLSSTGSPIALTLRTLGPGVDSVVTLASVSSPGASGGWSTLSGDYEIPSGVTSYRIRPVVLSTATAGVVHFDNGTGVKKTQTFFGNLLSLLGLEQWGDLHGTVDLSDIWSNIAQFFIDPLGFFANLVGGKLPDSQKPQWVQDITDNIHNAFANLGAALDSNNAAASVMDAILGVFSTGLGASTQASALAVRVRALESSAHTITDDFSGASASSLGGSWDQSYSGGGAGSFGLDGKGNAVWKPSGASSRICVGRYSASALTTDNGVISTVLSSTPQSYVFDDAYTYLNFRMDTAKTTYTRLLIGYASLRLQYVNSGAVSNFSSGSSVSLSPKAGDLLEVYFGEPGGANKGHFVVKRNGIVVIDYLDSSPVSTWGSSNRYVGAGVETGNRLVITQNIPAGLGVLTAAEVV